MCHKVPFTACSNMSSEVERFVLAIRAQLVGEQTFGKGVVQYYFPINNDGGVKLTVAKYLTPHRCAIALGCPLLLRLSNSP